MERMYLILTYTKHSVYLMEEADLEWVLSPCKSTQVGVNCALCLDTEYAWITLYSNIKMFLSEF